MSGARRRGSPHGDTLVLGDVAWNDGAQAVDVAYVVEGGPAFHDRYRFRGVDVGAALRGATGPALRGAFGLLRSCGAPTYQQLHSPGVVDVPAGLSPEERDLLADLLGPGLAEFRYVNGIDQGQVPTITGPVRDGAADALHLSGPPVVPFGGGKDSLAVVEALRANGVQPVLVVVGGHTRVMDSCRRTGLDHVVVDWRPDARVGRLQAAGAPRGHLPITALVSAAAVVVALCLGSDAVIMANERSASEPNLRDGDVWVNHQHSKSAAFEAVFRRALAASVTPSLAYFSLLRTAADHEIARYFSSLTAYDDVVVSCNHALGEASPGSRWCGSCAKCRYVFASLAVHMSRDRLVGIFGADVFADERAVPAYLQLLGAASWTKPMDCVGGADDARRALGLAAASAEWRDSPVLRALRRAVPESLVATAGSSREAPATEDHIPPAYRSSASSIR